MFIRNRFYIKIILLIVLGIIITGFYFGWWQWCFNVFNNIGRSQNNTERVIIDSSEFPKEEGEHPNLKLEWWYFAGHLEEEKNPKNKFGVTLIFDKNPAHIKANLINGILKENFSSVIKIDNYDILSKDNLTIQKGNNFWIETELFKYKIHYEFDDKEIDLILNSVKPPFITNIGSTAFYCQQTRVTISGFLSFSQQKYKVKGWGWIDHQGFEDSFPFYSWNWHAIQLDNNIEIVFMTYPDDQSGQIFKSSLFVYKDTQIETINNDNYSIEYINYWIDPKTKYRYPTKLRLKIPQKNANLDIEAILENQVIETIYKIYEGSTEVTGIWQGEKISGRAQIETINLEGIAN